MTESSKTPPDNCPTESAAVCASSSDTNRRHAGRARAACCSRRWSSAISPTASRSVRARLSRISGLELSPATIRNVMADLEEMGFVASPHTSAGRVPTPRGYRLFVDTLLTVRPLEQQQAPAVEGSLQIDEPQRAIAAASHCSRSCPQFAGVVLTPRRTVDVPPDRVPAPVGPARAADHRHPRRRRAEPHPAGRQRVHPVAAGRGRQLPQPALRRPSFEAMRSRLQTSWPRCATTSAN